MNDIMYEVPRNNLLSLHSKAKQQRAATIDAKTEGNKRAKSSFEKRANSRRSEKGNTADRYKIKVNEVTSEKQQAVNEKQNVADIVKSRRSSVGSKLQPQGSATSTTYDHSK